MPNDDGKFSGHNVQPPKSEKLSESSGSSLRPWFKTPEPIKRLFDRFPIQTYVSNELPRRTAIDRGQNTLYVFTTDEAAQKGAPSYNPGCLKWQAYLKFMEARFITVASNNHASPTGALPFLLPSARFQQHQPSNPIPSNKLQRWALDIPSAREETSNIRYSAYMSLLDGPIRKAWLYALYITPSNFESIAKPRYIYPASNNPLVRFMLSYQLRQAANTELLKYSTVIDVKSLYRDAEKAWEALSELLGDDEYFFAEQIPGLFDASVFSYTHLLTSESIPWRDQKLSKSLAKYGNLVQHSERISQRYFDGKQPP